MEAYISFPNPPWEATAPNKPAPGRELLWRILRRLIPPANPDFNCLYPRVSIWHLEVDAETGKPLREVGIDQEGQILVVGPWRDNHGFIVDSPVTFDAADHPQISAAQFEEEWARFTAWAEAAESSPPGMGSPPLARSR
jgi:hypothetical protein